VGFHAGEEQTKTAKGGLGKGRTAKREKKQKEEEDRVRKGYILKADFQDFLKGKLDAREDRLGSQRSGAIGEEGILNDQEKG